MRIIELAYPHDYKKESFPEIVAAIGFFDGIHLGHQGVIHHAINQAAKDKKKSAVVTFEPHPSVVLSNKEKSVKYITPKQEKMRVFKELGLDYVFIVKFNQELSELSPEEFLKHFIQDLHIVYLTGGFDFTFGKKGIGNMKTIHKYHSAPLETKMIKRITEDNAKISSTRIRKLLKQGQIIQVNKLLGRSFRVEGKVIPGEKRGRTIGFPTANLSLIEKDALLPKQGVYAVSVCLHNQIVYGVANLGYNPTFQSEDNHLKLEVHLFDFNKDIYGEILTVCWHEFIREEKKFSSVNQLVSEIRNDVRITKEYFALNPLTT